MHQVQSSVDGAVIWSNIWVILNYFKKSKHLHISSRHDSVTYTMDSGHGVIELEKVTSEKDLGFIVDQALNISEHLSTKVSKANRNLCIIFRTLTYKDTELFLKLYVNCTTPSRIRRNCMFTSIQKGYNSTENVPRRATKLVSSTREL